MTFSATPEPATGVAVGSRAVNLAAVEIAADNLRIKEAQVFPGCPLRGGVRAADLCQGRKIIDIEGDPDTPYRGRALPERIVDVPVVDERAASTKAMYRARAARRGKRSRSTG